MKRIEEDMTCENGDTRIVDLCQIENASTAAKLRRPGSLHVPWRILWNLRQHGVRYTLALTARAQIKKFRERVGFELPCAPTPHCGDAVLNLQAGEWVEVKSLEEIQRTLDGKSRNFGLVFTPEMKKHLGKRYRVYKRLELMFDEYHKSQRRLKNTVLLEQVVCEGTGLGCDRSCFLYWREAWLRRCGPPATLPEKVR